MLLEQLSAYKELGIGLIVLLLLLVLTIRGMIRGRRNRILRDLDPRKIGIQDIDRMEDGSEFELYLQRLLSALGYKDIYKTTSSRDFGADLVFTDREGARVVIQAKRYAVQHPVGLGAVQEIYTSMRYYAADKSVIITSGRYTESCKTLAAVNGVKLLDRNDLVDMIDLFKAKRREEVMERIESKTDVVASKWWSKSKS
ncbi:endonuclease [Paenibacillus jamilae]|uniref:Endonuclease n=2 Tax=Paenibacillus TaxID=44249 RepID=A0ACC4ZRK7_9BACL|nr:MULTISPECIES: restriction endonuclease [Paenibacillus]AJE53094.1 endonuclease [Paenibacillus polymyxa]AUO07915.1 restriction endonuclease [Paenibacillus sp. lzh-N1]KTS80977.1 endonuclease [Paenibacillus jamilae]QOH63062.1 restriction endonuclease [Paenibacillus polymyxa]